MFRNADFASRALEIQSDRRRRVRRRGTNHLRDRIPCIEFLESRLVLSADTWTGLGGTNLWQDGGNWVGGQAPNPGDDLVFPQLTGTGPFVAVNNFDAGTTFNSITIEGSGYDLEGQELNLTAGITATGYSGTSVDNLDTDLGGGSIEVDAGAALSMGTEITGTAGLTLTGGGSVALSAANTYSGGTTISAGTTVAANSASLSSGAVTDDGELDLSNTTLTNAITLDSTGNAIVNTSGTSSLNGPITLGLDATIDVTSGSTLMFFGAIGDGSPSNGYGLTETGGGLLITAATTSNTYTGDTTVESGTLELDQQWGSYAIAGNLNIGDGTDTAEVLNWQNNQIDPGAYVTLNGANASLNLNGLVDTVAVLTFNGGSVTTGAGTLTLARNLFSNGTSPGSTATISGNLYLASNFNHVFSVYSNDAPNGIDLDVSAVITGGATTGINKSGSGTLALDADNSTTFAGTTRVQVGTLDVTATGALGSGPAEVDSNPTAALELDGSGGDITLSNDIALESTSNEIVNLAGSNILSGAITLDAGANIDVESGSTLTISGAIGQSGGSFGVTKIASGRMVYAASAANTYTGTTTVSLGELDFDSTAANGAIGGPLTIGASPFGSARVEYLASSQVPSTTDVTVQYSQSTLDLDGFSDTVNDLNVNGGLVSLPAGSSLTAAGLTMTGGDINTGAGSTFTVNGDATINDSAGGSTIDGTGSLVLGGSPTTFTVDTTTPAVGLDITVPIGGSGGLTMTGGGTLQLSGVNIYTGGTTVNDGTISAQNDADAFGTGTVTINSDSMAGTRGEVQVGGTSLVTIPNAFVLNSSDASGDPAIQTTTGVVFIAGTITMETDTTVAAESSSILDFSGVVSGPYSLTEIDGGRFVLGNSNSYSGGTIVNGGQLTSDSQTWAFGTGPVTVNNAAQMLIYKESYFANVTLDNDITLDSTSTAAIDNMVGDNTLTGTITLEQTSTINAESGTTLIIQGAIGDGSPSNGFGITTGASGTVELEGISTYKGATTVSSGTLQVDATGSIVSSIGVTVQSGGMLDGGGAVPALMADSGGTVAPGTASGTAILSSGNLSLATGSSYSVVLNGTMAGISYDQLNVTGTVDLDSGSTGGATLNVALGYTPSIGDSFTLIANDGSDPVQGTFLGQPEGSILTVDSQTFKITYTGGPDSNAVVLTDMAMPTVNVTATPNPSQYGQSATFSVNVTGGGPTPTGTVQFYDGDPATDGTPIGMLQTLDGSGDASIQIDSLSVGSHPIYAEYSGDSLYLDTTQMLIGGQDVTPDLTTTSVSSAQSSTTYGDQVIFTALVSAAFGGPPTGTVEFFDGMTDIGAVTLNSIGVATFTTTTLSVADSPHMITAEYAGNEASQGSTSAPYRQTITAADLTITADSTSKTYGNTVTFDGTEFSAAGLVNDDSVDAVTLSSAGAAGTAAVAGSPYTITTSNALGTGLGNYAISYVPGQIVVTPAALIITANDQSRAYGTPNPTLTANYSGFVNGDTPASLTTPVILSTTATSSSPVSSYPIAAANATSPNYAITFHAGTLAVTTASSLTTLATPTGASVVGQAVSFTVHVGPGPNVATGSVNFIVDGTMAASMPVDSVTGLATWTTTSLGPGSHTISAAYAGDANVLASRSSVIQEVVNQANSQSGLGSELVRNRRGKIIAVDLDAAVLAVSPGSGIPAGVVNFFQGQRRLGKATLNGGTAELAVKPGLVLKKTVTMSYSGNANFLSSVSPKVHIATQSITATARPFAAFYTRSHFRIARPMARHASLARAK